MMPLELSMLLYSIALAVGVLIVAKKGGGK